MSDRSHFCALVFVLVLYPAMAASEVQVIFSAEAGKCSLSVEANDQWHTLRLRVHPEYKDCHVGKDSMLSALAAAFSKTESPRLEGPYSSLFIGRLIDYPWLSQYLAKAAERDARWDKKKGKPVAMDINKYVSSLLSTREIRAEIEETFGESGYRVVSVTVEKVLVGGFRDVPLYEGKIMAGRVPYDAMVWFRLAKN
jgi:hypothetical protein